jgi:hypothetical protein
MSTVSHLGPYFPERTAIVSKSTHDAAGVKRKAADDVRTRKPKKMKSILSWGANASRPPGAPSAPPREPNHNAPASGTIMELTTSTSRDAVPPPIEFQFPHDLLKSLAKHLPSSYPSGAAPPHLITEFVFHGSFSICYFPQSSHPHARRLHMIIHELRMMGLLLCVLFSFISNHLASSCLHSRLHAQLVGSGIVVAHSSIVCLLVHQAAGFVK